MRLLRRHRMLIALAVMATALVPITAQARTFAPGAGTGGDPYFPNQGNGGYDVQHYDISFSYDPPTDRMVGTTTMTAVSTHDLSQFNLDFTGMTVRAVRVDQAPASAFLQQGTELVVTPPAGIVAGRTFVVDVDYDGFPANVIDPDGTPDGWIRTDDGAFVASAPQGAMTWFPGNHDLRDKATHRIAATVPNGSVAVANGSFVSQTTSGGMTTFVWNSQEPMTDYLATATIGQFALTRGTTPSGLENNTAVDPRVSLGGVAQTAAVLDWLSGRFGPYPFSSTGGIVDYAPDVGYALETQTRPVYSFTPPVDLVVHELAHQWYGDSVGITTWRDVWLNEGFVTYAEWLWSEHTGGSTAQQRFNALYSRSAGDPFWQVPPGDPGAVGIYHPAVYDRGAMTLYALRSAVGGRTLLYILRKWAAQHRFGTGTTAEFIALAERMSGRQLDSLFQKWLYTPGKPSFP